MACPLLDSLTLAEFAIALRPESELILPGYKGGAFRGGFGYAFKSIVCPTHDTDCIHSRLGNTCVYSEVFETPVPPGSVIMRKYPRAPHPFVLTPPLEPRSRFTAEDELSLGLVLVGRAIPWLAYFICTLEELGRRGVGPQRSRYQIHRAESLIRINGSGSVPRTLVYDGTQRKVMGVPHIIQAGDFPDGREIEAAVTIGFLTPVRIVCGGELASKLPFVTLFRTLLRRLALLAYFHCGQPANVEAMRGLIKAAEAVRVKESSLRWHDWQRYSTRQQTRMKLGGLVGQISYEGELAPFLPFLRVGELTHVGKGTSFGLGRYILREDR